MNELQENILIVVIVVLVLFLIFREVHCWYWKINKRIELQEKQIEILKEILTELKGDSISQKENNSGVENLMKFIEVAEVGTNRIIAFSVEEWDNLTFEERGKYIFKRMVSNS